MATQMRSFWQNIFGQRSVEQTPATESAGERVSRIQEANFPIAPNDPLIAYFQSTQGVIEVDRLNLESPALEAMRTAGIKLAVPLVSQGELIGILNLGSRLSEQDYSGDDYKLLGNLAIHAAPALRVAQLVRQQQAEVQIRERIEQELRVARVIQHTLLPKHVPELPGWQVAAHYQPARAVGGDFYDFLSFPDGKMGFVVGDVTDKGVPAALVMATTRSILRAAAERLTSPGEVLARVNELLTADIPPKMFVTCLYAVLDPATGHLAYANAGHDLPYQRTSHGVEELRATGMPLGLMTGMTYEEKETVLEPGDTLLLYSDGLVEAHSPTREMFGFPRLQALMADHPGGSELVGFLLDQLAGFTGADWEQEDDVTMVILERTLVTERRSPNGGHDTHNAEDSMDTDNWQVLAEFSVLSEPGNERAAMQRVAEIVQDMGISPTRMERLKTAVAETTMNAMEHGNKYRADLPVVIRLLASPAELVVQVIDQGGAPAEIEAATPDLEAKLQGLQTPRGWGLFLIQNMVDELRVSSGESEHMVELVMHLEGEQHG